MPKQPKISAAQFQATSSNEHLEQKHVFDYIDLMLNIYPHWESIYAIPNAGKRSYGALQYYIQEGMKPGMIDWCAPFARGPFHSLYVEMKWGKKTHKANQPRENQVYRIELLRSLGNKVEVCYGFEEAKAVLLEYENL